MGTGETAETHEVERDAAASVAEESVAVAAAAST